MLLSCFALTQLRFAAPRPTAFVGFHSCSRHLLHLRLTQHPRSAIAPIQNTMYSSFSLASLSALLPTAPVPNCEYLVFLFFTLRWFAALLLTRWNYTLAPSLEIPAHETTSLESHSVARSPSNEGFSATPFASAFVLPFRPKISAESPKGSRSAQLRSRWSLCSPRAIAWSWRRRREVRRTGTVAPEAVRRINVGVSASWPRGD